MVTYAFDDFIFDSRRGELWRKGARVGIDRQPLELLALLLRHAERIVSKNELIQEVWGGRIQSDQGVSVCVARLRKALGGLPDEYIKTIYGQGYRFVGLLTPALDARPAARRLEKRLTRADLALGAIVGRTGEVARLRMALSHAESGSGRACALLGEPGIGKTRIAEQLRSEALEAGFSVSWGNSHIFDHVPPMWPWLQIFDSRKEELSSERTDYPLGVLASDLSRGDWHRIVTWLRDVVSDLTAQRPWLIVLEDLHWADAATLSLLTHVIADLPRHRLLLLLTARETELPDDGCKRQPLDYVLGHRACETISLQRLSDEDVREYIERKFSTADETLSRSVMDKSEGNPFFMIELLRAWDSGQVVDASALRVPDQAFDIIRQRLRTLDPRVAETLAAAAVLGRTFDLGTLMTVCPCSGEALVQIVGVALTAGLIRRDCDSAVSYQFSHNLVRQVLYDDLPIATRAQLHKRAADALAQRSLAEESLIATHLLKATPFSDVTQAVTAGRQAAAALARRGRYREACGLLRRCIDAWRAQAEPDLGLLSATLCDLAVYGRAAGEPGSARHLVEAARLACRYELVDVLFSAGTRMSRAPGAIAECGAHSVLDTTLGILSPDDHRRRASVLSHLAWTHPNTRDGNRVELLLKDANHHAALADSSARRALLRARVYFAGGPDDHERTLSLAVELEELAQDRDPTARAFASIEPSFARFMTFMQRCAFPAAQRALDSWRGAIHALKHAELTWQYERAALARELATGDLKRARDRLLQLKSESERLDLHDHQVISAIDWTELNRLLVEHRPFADQYVLHLRLTPDDDPTVQSAKLRTLVHLGHIEEAHMGLRRVSLDQLYALPKSRDYLAQLANLSLAAAATDMREHAGALYELLRRYPHLYIASLSAQCHGVVSHVLGILARSLGNAARARGHFDDAIKQQERLGLVLPLARSRYELGALLLASRLPHDRAHGISALESAHLDACRLGLEPLRVEIEKLLQRAPIKRLRTGG